MKKQIALWLSILLCFTFLSAFAVFAAPEETDSSGALPSSSEQAPSSGGEQSTVTNSEAVSSQTPSSKPPSVTSTTAESAPSSSKGQTIQPDNPDDSVDSDGWGGIAIDSEIVVGAQEAGTSSNAPKAILDLRGFLLRWIWLPVLLILASVGAIVYINTYYAKKHGLKKEKLTGGFDLEADGEGGRKKKARKSKKAGRKKASGVRRPRD